MAEYKNMRFFYHKIIVIEEIVEDLHQMDFSVEEKNHLANLVDTSLHHVILDEILSNLKDNDKRAFLKMISEDPESEKLCEFLNGKIDGVDKKIKKVADDLIKEMKKDILEAKKLA